MPSLSNWLDRRAASAPAPGSALTTSSSTSYPQPKDPNISDHRLQIASRCIYERQMPGGSYITTHIERLQTGYYDSPVVHEDCISNVRFIALRFVFHEASTERRFRAATIRISLLDEQLRPEGIPLPPQIDHPDDDVPPTEKLRAKPKFLKYSPHLLYGAMSPENLDWNFNLAGSLGTVQAPVSASVNPSYGIKSSYKVYKMMKIQGSLRTNSSWHGKYYDIDDGELVWTLEENELQKSGLPREFTFVMMLTKGDVANNVRFEIDIQPEVASWFGSYPQWWVHLLKYQPLHKDPLDLDKEIGQRFAPCGRTGGYNFAGLMSTFDKFVTMPGTMYSAQDWSVTQAPAPTTGSPTTSVQQKQRGQPTAYTQSPTQIKSDDESAPSNTVHLRIHLDQAQRQGPAMSASYTATEPASTSTTALTSRQRQSAPTQRRSPPSSTISAGKPAIKNETTINPGASSTASSTGPISRRLTIDGTTAKPTPPKYKLSRVPPLQTHFEECTPSPPKLKSSSSEEEIDHGYEYSFPEYMYSTAPDPPGQSNSASGSNHRHHRSTSTSSSTGVLPKTSPSVPGPTQYQPPSTSQPQAQQSPQSKPPKHHSLRRTRSRNSLRRSISLSSTPEDEQAISDAMDMLSGSPPPPAPAPPASAPPVLNAPRGLRTKTISSQAPIAEENHHDDDDNVILATPRTRAALADLLEVERAEKARVQRRNGNPNAAAAEATSIRQPPLTISHRARARDDSSVGRSEYSSNSTSNKGGSGSGDIQPATSDQERRRQKRYSMPVTSSGIGYPGTSRGSSAGGAFEGQASSGDVIGRNGVNSNGMSSIQPTKYGNSSSRDSEADGHGRSSLMIPIGSKPDNGLGIGIATSTPEASSGINASSAKSRRRDDGPERSGILKRDNYSGYDGTD